MADQKLPPALTPNDHLRAGVNPNSPFAKRVRAVGAAHALEAKRARLAGELAEINKSLGPPPSRAEIKNSLWPPPTRDELLLAATMNPKLYSPLSPERQFLTRVSRFKAAVARTIELERDIQATGESVACYVGLASKLDGEIAAEAQREAQATEARQARNAQATAEFNRSHGR